MENQVLNFIQFKVVHHFKDWRTPLLS